MRSFGMAAVVLVAAAQAHGQAKVFKAQDVQSQLAALAQQAQAKGSSGATLDQPETGPLMLSVRTKSGGAEVHAHFMDVMIVTGGSATLITGGTVAGAHTDAGGETKGASIEGGQSQTISKGDIVEVPAGTPHQLIIPPGVVYSSFVVKVKQ